MVVKFPGIEISSDVGPNITGTFEADELYTVITNPVAKGSFYLCDSYATRSAGGEFADIGGIGLDASRSSQVYGRSTTVQPTALKLLPCIKF